MSAVVEVTGTVRTVKVLNVKASGKRFGRAVSVLTESHGVLGETFEVTVFDPREGEPAVQAELGDHVVWVVDVESTNFGLRGTLKQVVGQTALGSPAFEADPWLSGAPDPSAAAV